MNSFLNFTRTNGSIRNFWYQKEIRKIKDDRLVLCVQKWNSLSLTNYYLFFPVKIALFLKVLHFRWCWQSVKSAWERGPPSAPVDIFKQIIHCIIVWFSYISFNIFMYIDTCCEILKYQFIFGEFCVNNKVKSSAISREY